MEGHRQLAAACQLAKGGGNGRDIGYLRRERRELCLKRGMQVLRLVVEQAVAVIYSVAYLREDLLKEQAPRVLRVKHCGPYDLCV